MTVRATATTKRGDTIPICIACGDRSRPGKSLCRPCKRALRQAVTERTTKVAA